MLTFAAGMKLIVAKNYAAVYERSIEALKNNEKDPLPFFFLGILATDCGNSIKALELFAKASEHGPKNPRYQAYHAKALMNIGNYEDAKIRADIAAKIGANDAFEADMIGLVYSRTGYHKQALPLFELAIKKNPKWAKFHYNLAASAQFVGDFEKAKTAYITAVSLNSNLYQAWFALVSLEKQTPNNSKLETLKTLFKSIAGDAEASLIIGHSIAKTLEDLGQYEESFDWLEKAKVLKKIEAEYNKEDTSRTFEAAKAMPPPTPDFFGADNTPIFIVGLPRTGTTLVDRILSSHEEVFSAGELNIFTGLVKRNVSSGPKLATDTEALIAAATIDLTEIRDAYAKHSHSLAGDAPYIIDKTPLNFLYAGLIYKAFPNAKIIGLRRGAMDSCLSNFRQVFATNNHDYDYTFDIEDMASFYCEFDALMAHWKEILPADKFIEVHYEDIVFDQENQTRRLLAFCGLDWDAACMQFHENTAAVDTASSVQVRKPLYSGAIGRWKKYGKKLNALKKSLRDLNVEH